MELVVTPLLIIKTGDTLDTVKQAHGDFHRMFEDQVRSEHVATAVVEVHKGDRPEIPRSYAGVIITGSPHSVTDGQPWVDETAEWVRQAAKEGVPILGVCYGHQLLGYAFGAPVSQNPNGYEIGTVEVELTARGEEDPLFAGLAHHGALTVHAAHADVVLSLPKGATLLAKNELTPIQAFGIDEHVRAVQFHPEFTKGIAQKYVEGRGERVRANAAKHGRDPERTFHETLSNVGETPAGPEILKRFVKHFVLGGSK